MFPMIYLLYIPFAACLQSIKNIYIFESQEHNYELYPFTDGQLVMIS